jgi:hypothetical protein
MRGTPNEALLVDRSSDIRSGRTLGEGPQHHRTEQWDNLGPVGVGFRKATVPTVHPCTYRRQVMNMILYEIPRAVTARILPPLPQRALKRVLE